MSHEPQATKPKRRWFRFRLRTLFGLVTVLALLMGWVAKERRQSHYERQFAERMEKQGDFIDLGGPYDSLDLWASRQPQGWWRALAQQVLGERILVASTYRPNFKDLTQLTGLTNLQSLWLTSPQIDDLAPLAGLQNLKHLMLLDAQVGDDKVKSLGQALPNCRITRHTVSNPTGPIWQRNHP